MGSRWVAGGSRVCLTLSLNAFQQVEIALFRAWTYEPGNTDSAASTV